jgi:pyruvate/2-oxoglutarate dehydrogenase complex dihydrolipoamide dehydrogenase (E3) component
MEKYDAIIIGSGQAGGPLAKKLAKAGKKTVLIEKRYVGGTCVNDGCTPTKTWVASAKMAYMANTSAFVGVDIKNYKVDMPRIKKRKDDVVMSARNGGQKALEATKNLTLIFGEARFIDEKVILIELNEGGTLEMTADLIFINAGAKALIPDIEGLNEINYLTNTSILELAKIPKHLLVIGANYIGMEFGQMFHRFGSKVTLLERGPRILAREDSDIAEEMHKLLTDEHIDIYTDAETTGFKKTKKGNIKATVNVGGKEQKITCSHVLVAAGRVAQTEAMQLDKTGCEG